MKHFYFSLKYGTIFLLLFFCTLNIKAQDITVTGTVIDAEEGTYLIGVTILEKGTTHGTVTDINGDYSIKVTKGTMLVFSFIGYTSQEVIADKPIINVKLRPKAMLLEETVVIGYGTQRKKNLTGSISKVTGKELTEIPIPSFEAGLQGKAAGVQIIQSNGMAGAGSAVRVRGVGSITAGGDPLYVIDGIPIVQNQIIQGSAGNEMINSLRIGGVNTNPLNFINPNDIESIEILKDASATAIYGSRGANGVILITTKRGHKGVKSKPIFDVNYKIGFARPTKLYDLLDNEEYITLYQEAYENDAIYGNGTFYDGPWVTLPGGISREEALKTNTDWQQEMIRTGISQGLDVSFKQGSKRLGTYLGVSYSDENSFLINNSFKRFAARANVDFMVTEKLDIGVTASFTRGVTNHVPVSWTGGLGKAQSAALPYFPIYYCGTADSGYYQFPEGQNGPGNPVKQLDMDILRTRELRTLSTIYLNYKIIKDLSIRVDGSIDYLDLDFNDYNKAFREIPQGRSTMDYMTNWNTKAILNYFLNVKGSHDFNFMLGTELLSNTMISKRLTLTGIDKPIYKDPEYPPEFIDGQPNPDYQIETFPTSKYSFVSYFGRVNYAFSKKYLVTLILRRDASSRFGVNNKFGTFPAASLGWIMTEEKFLQDNKFFSFLKLKTGYGITGNAEIPNYAQYGITNTTSPITYNGQNIIFQTNLENPNLKWETTKTYDVGVEYGLLKDRIHGEISYYYKKTEDLFLNIQVQSSSGWTNVLKNIGSMRNTGVEFDITSVNIQRKLVWKTNLNFAYNNNKVLDIGNATPDALAGTGDTRVLVGHPIGVNYLIPVVRIDPADGRPVYLDINGNETKEYNLDDRRVVGKPYPDVIGGFTNYFTYRNWELNFMFNFCFGNDIYDDSEKFQYNDLGWNLVNNALDRWQKPGDVTDVARLTLGQSDIERIRNTDEYLHDGSYVRLKSLIISYNFPNKLISKLKLNSAKISLIGTNLLTFTSYPGLDPEIFRDMENVLQKNTSPSVTYLTPPQARTFSVAINISF
ncbi:MAG: TonB-dependent receptor [Bacteroidetes bacterium]|nr:TonB-dependent receptor [Bacteroidota bacterium]